MQGLDELLRALKPYCADKPGERVFNELTYARRISFARGGAEDALVRAALEAALAEVRLQGAATYVLAEQVEHILMPMQAACKRLTWLLAGHAHIDMNWQWPMEDTVSIVLNTFRTMLNLMKEYPTFHFSQSQASTYAIVEAYNPDMLEEIKARIKEGRWEVTASSWVEPDRNMPSLESEARHLLYTKRYLSHLLDIREDSLNLDFEPDTFGHNAKIPDVLTGGGVRYLYHCRGEKNETLYRWRGRTGRELLVYCDPDWYNNFGFGADIAQRLPQFCEQYGLDRYLTVFGVGDHGGGPTRRDLDHLCEMMTWPIFPTVRFSTFGEYFNALESIRNHLPVLTGERNSMFSGCYTTQTRIKRGNILAERSLQDTELFSSLAHICANAPYNAPALEEAWRKVLFSHFHDILPGSCKRETREFAMGQYQLVTSAVDSARSLSLAKLCGAIDTSKLSAFDVRIASDHKSEAYAIDAMQGGLTPRRDGLRVFHLFNPLPETLRKVVPLVVWDYDQTQGMEFILPDGTPVAHQMIDHRRAFGSANMCTDVLLAVTLPACGYITVALRPGACPKPAVYPVSVLAWRQEEAFDMTLENERIRAEFDPKSARLTRLTDKQTGREMAFDGGFDWIEEAPDSRSAWVIGQYMSVRPAGVRTYIKTGAWGDLRKAFTVRTEVNDQTHIQYTVSLDQDANHIVYDAVCNWREFGSARAIPNLSYSVRLPQAPDMFRSRLPGGTINRPGVRLDQASLQVIAANGIALMSDCKYGFRGYGDKMSVTLVRGSIAPDPIPDIGEIPFKLAIGLVSDRQVDEETRRFLAGTQVVDAVSGFCHTGTLPMESALLSLSGSGLSLSCVKLAEAGDGLIVRICSDTDTDTQAVLTLPYAVQNAHLTDITERVAGDAYIIEDNRVLARVPAHDVITVLIRFARSPAAMRS